MMRLSADGFPCAKGRKDDFSRISTWAAADSRRLPGQTHQRKGAQTAMLAAGQREDSRGSFSHLAGAKAGLEAVTKPQLAPQLWKNAGAAAKIDLKII
jgi:hypothetical protein